LLCLAAGGEVSYWNGGFDDAFAKFRPGLVGLVEAIGHAIAAGDSRFDLGPGDHQYKVRLADCADRVVTVAVSPKSVRTGAEVVLRRGRRALASRMTPGQKQRLRRVLDAISFARVQLLA
jgi:CelD/BcsL family acetyltransferase involved in cellulose biosynthesis